MSSLTNTKIKDTYPALLKASDNGVIGATEKVITDGLGNNSTLSLGTNSASVAGTLAFGSLKDTGENITITKFVDEADGISANDNDTSIPTSAAVKNYVDNAIPAEADTLDSVTDRGSTTTNSISVGNVTSTSFIKSGGTSTEFLKADGSVDSNTYLTAESDTLDAVTDRGNTTTNSITVGSLTSTDDSTINGLTIGKGANDIFTNTALGYISLASNTTGSDNTAVGANSLVTNSTGNDNTAIGRNALVSSTTGSRNTALGNQAGDSLTTGSDNIYIGNNADASSLGVNGEIVIGSSATGKGSNTSLIAGDYVYLGDGTLGSAIIERIANPAIVLIDTANSETFNITNNYIGGQVNYNSTTLNHIFRIGGDIKLTIGSSSVSVSDALSVTGNLAVDTNTLYVDAANNRVGVGISSPAVPLHTVGESLFEGRLQITSATPEILFSVPSGGLDSRIHNDGSGNFIFGTGTNSSTPTERMRIDSSGNVGIGTSTLTTNPLINELHIDNAVTNGVSRLRLSSSVEGVESMIAMDGYLGTDSMVFSIGSTGAATERMRIDSVGQLFCSNDNLVLTYAGTDAIVATNGNKNMLFYTNGSERMRITSGGQVEINRTSDLGNGFLEINGSASRSAIACNQISTATSYQIYFSNPNGIVGSISTSALLTAYNTTSDYRLKENVVEMTGALDRVDALKPSRFNFIADPNTTVDGFIAHEVQAIVPEAVTGEKDAVDEEGNPIYQGIDQSKIVPLLVGAIKELKAEIELLKSQLS